MRRLAAAVVLCAPMPAAAQPLEEIEAWVFERLSLVGSQGAVWPREISTDGVIAAHGQYSTDGVSFASRVFADFGSGPVVVPIPTGKRTSFQPEVDDHGRVYAVTNGDRVEDMAPIFFDGVNMHPLPVPQQFTCGYSGVSPTGRVVALASNINDPQAQRPILIWDNPTLQPRVIPQPWINGLPTDRGIEFFPQDITDQGSIIGIFQAVPSGEVFGAGWLKDDETLVEVALPSTTTPIMLQFRATNELEAIGLSLIPIHPGATAFTYQLLVTDDTDSAILAVGDFDTRPSGDRSQSGLSVVAQNGTMTLRSGSAVRLISEVIASPMYHPTGGVQDLRNDATIVTDYGILRPTTCLADANQDGSLNPADFDAWLNAYVGNQSIADQNLDQQVTPADFSAWVIRYNRGCD
jgi:hypothetical protein